MKKAFFIGVLTAFLMFVTSFVYASMTEIPSVKTDFPEVKILINTQPLQPIDIKPIQLGE